MATKKVVKKREGRKLPTVIKERRGTLRSDRVNHEEPEFENKEIIPLAPASIKTKLGQQLYVRCAAQLSGVGLLFETTFEYLERYCANYERIIECENMINTMGLIMQNDKGNWVKNPAVTVQNEAFTIFFNIGREFGFTPVSKSKLVADAGNKGPGKKNSTKKATFR